MGHFFRRRRELNEIAQREAAGESFWHANLEPETRARITLALRNQVDGSDFTAISKRAIREVATDEGNYSYLREDFLHLCETSDDETFLTLIEAFMYSARSHFQSGPSYQLLMFVNVVPNEIGRILSEDRVSYELIDGQFIPFESRALHVSLTEPALTLLRRPGKLDKVETAYRNALEEVSQGNPADAITDCGTALQELLLSLGCEGNALGPLVSSAKRKHIIPGHDSRFADAVVAAIDTVSANRSQKGDSHRVASETTAADAWFIIHIVGSLILRLEPTEQS